MRLPSNILYQLDFDILYLYVYYEEKYIYMATGSINTAKLLPYEITDKVGMTEGGLWSFVNLLEFY